MNRTEIETIVVEKAQSDPAFRQQLIAHPRAAIESVMGRAIPADKTITVFEEAPTRLALVLPYVPPTELSDDDLADISGGADNKSGHARSETQAKARATERLKL